MKLTRVVIVNSRSVNVCCQLKNLDSVAIRSRSCLNSNVDSICVNAGAMTCECVIIA